LRASPVTLHIITSHGLPSASPPKADTSSRGHARSVVATQAFAPCRRLQARTGSLRPQHLFAAVFSILVVRANLKRRSSLRVTLRWSGMDSNHQFRSTAFCSGKKRFDMEALLLTELETV
jgi:hypothetical protein